MISPLRWRPIKVPRLLLRLRLKISHYPSDPAKTWASFEQTVKNFDRQNEEANTLWDERGLANYYKRASQFVAEQSEALHLRLHANDPATRFRVEELGWSRQTTASSSTASTIHSPEKVEQFFKPIYKYIYQQVKDSKIKWEDVILPAIPYARLRDETADHNDYEVIFVRPGIDPIPNSEFRPAVYNDIVSHEDWVKDP